MYPRGFSPRGRPPYSSQGHLLPSPPRLPQHQRVVDAQLNAANSFRVHPKPTGPDMIPPFEWKPAPPVSPALGLQLPAINNGRKRQHGDLSPHASKRQRVDFSPHRQRGSPLLQTSPSVARLSGMLDGSLPSPHSHPYPQVPAIPGGTNMLQAYAKDKLSRQMLELFEACQQQESDMHRKEICRTQLQRDIQNMFPAARLYMTGSSMNGLGLRTSDADLCLVLLGSMGRLPDPIHILSELQRLFRSLSYLKNIQLIRAKVPILKFKEKNSDLEFDLNVNNTVGIRNTFLLKSYVHADVRVRPVILVIKKWARHHHINDASKGTLSSYTLVLMVLHYLQTQKVPVLPCLQKDYPECFNPSMEIDMVPEACRHIPLYISKNQSSLGDLLLGFLKYFAVFSWEKHVISVREARTFLKKSCQEWSNTLLCVEEPFERKNVARAVRDLDKFKAIHTQFFESHETLKQRKDLNSILPVRFTINQESSRRYATSS